MVAWAMGGQPNSGYHQGSIVHGEKNWLENHAATSKREKTVAPRGQRQEEHQVGGVSGKANRSKRAI